MRVAVSMELAAEGIAAILELYWVLYLSETPTPPED